MKKSYDESKTIFSPEFKKSFVEEILTESTNPIQISWRYKSPSGYCVTGKSNMPEVAEKYGADGYAKTAGTAVDEAIHLLKMLKEEEAKK